MARETGWYSWEEWGHVKKLLYCFDDVTNQNEGLRMVQMWKSRLRSGTLPVAVELTSTLLTAHLSMNNFSEQANRHQCQLGSAMALVRFVNGVTDQLQTGLYVESVQAVADRVHIPEWIVELRHSATHSYLPSMEILHSGLMFALNWLYQSYWEETSIKFKEMEQAFELKIRNYLSEYVELTFNVLCEVTSPNAEVKLSDKALKSKRSKNLCRCQDITQLILKVVNNGNVHKVITIFVQRGFLIPNEEQLKVLNFSGMFEYLKEANLEVFDELVNFWRPLVEGIEEKFPAFLELLVKEIIKYSLTGNSRVMYFSRNMWSGLLSIFILSKLAPHSHIHMVRFLVEHPSPISFQILSGIAESSSVTPLNEEFKMKLKMLLEVFEDCVSVLMKPCNVEIDLQKELSDVPSMSEYLKVLESVRRSPKEEEKVDLKPIITKWQLVSPRDLKKLPPMGQYFEPISRHYNLSPHTGSQNSRSLHLNDDKKSALSHHEGDADETSSNYTSDELMKIIDNLFTDDSIMITDDDDDNTDRESTLTEEYRISTDEPWNEEDCIDFDVKVEEKPPKRLVNINDIDVTKIMFL